MAGVRSQQVPGARRLEVFLFLLSICLFPRTLAAQGANSYAPSEPSFREACRQEIAGRLLADHDRKKKGKGTIQVAQGQVQRFQGELKAVAVKLTRVEETYREQEFDAQEAQNLASIKYAKDALESALAQASLLLEKAKKDYEEAVTSLRYAEAAIEKVFEVKRIDPSKAQGGYPYQLEYRTSCPKYRYLCKLPPAEAKNLLELFGNETPETCRKYAQLSGAS